MKPEPVETCVETYLRRATRGLWGKKRLEVREELAAHLEERVMAYRIGGLGETDAVKKALAELGKPQEVSFGMARLYTFPTLLGSGAVLAAAFVLVVALLPKGAAQSPVIGSFFWPSPKCTAALRTDSVLAAFNSCQRLDNNLWLDTKALTKTLEAQGVTVRQEDKMLTLTFPSLPPVEVPLDSSSLLVNDSGEVVWLLDSGDIIKGTEISAVPSALSLWDLLEAVGKQSKLPIRLEGDKNPTVHLGEVSFQVGTKLRSVNSDDFYDNYLENVFFRDLVDPIEMKQGFFAINSRVDTDTPLEEAELGLKAAESGVYGIITILAPDTLDRYLSRIIDPFAADFYASFEVVRVEDGNMFSAKLPEKPVRFVKAFSADKNIGSAVIVRLAGSSETGGWYEVVSPDRITVQ